MSAAKAGGGASGEISAQAPNPLRQPLQGCHLRREGRIIQSSAPAAQVAGFSPESLGPSHFALAASAPGVKEDSPISGLGRVQATKGDLRRP